MNTPLLENPSTASRWAFRGTDVSTRCIPALRAAQGGDWCEAFAVAPNVLALSIGDVCGHGPGAWAPMVVVRDEIRRAARAGCAPAEVLAAATRALHGYDPDGYATALFALLNVATNALVFANAGHPAPLVIGPLGTASLEFDPQPPLGIDAFPQYRERTLQLADGALLVAFTDGVSERSRDAARGIADLGFAAAAAYRAPRGATAADLTDRLALNASNDDDAAILAVWLAEPVRELPVTTGRQRHGHRIGARRRARMETAAAGRRGLGR